VDDLRLTRDPRCTEAISAPALVGPALSFYRSREVRPMKAFLFVAVIAVAGTGCSQEQNQSIERLNKCVGAYTKREYATAINECEKSIALWKENHSAWWHIGGAHLAQKRWKEASEAFEKALQIKETEPMYHQMLGISLYYKAIDDAAVALAAREGKKPLEVIGSVNLAVLNFEGAIQHLQRAIKLNPALWNSHYHLGRIYRDTDKPTEAATELTEAIRQNPFEAAPYIALAELYRQWDYPDQAIQIASIGTTYVPGAQERSNVFYMVGMGYNDKRQDDKAIEAFTKAIDDRRDNHSAKFQRGQAYYRKNDCSKAKKDLEDYSKSGSASDQLAKQQANKMLMDCAAKQL
jgi:tetratricopeptide (TPR) repeat protein